MKLRGNVHYVGVNDRTSACFESMWSLENGVSYNAYLIDDEKIALVDTVEVAFFSSFITNIRSIIGERPIDYLIINHMEPDHSGSIALIKQYYPNIQIVGNKKTFEMIAGFYEIQDDACIIVDDKSVLELGHHTLNFCLIPMVHWPETMVTFDIHDKIIFSGDAFGCFGAINGLPLDTKIDYKTYLPELTRYYACILGKYGSTVQRALQKLSHLAFDMICSTHGPIWTAHAPEIWQRYDELSKGLCHKGLVIVYGSMYGHTQQIAEAIAVGASKAGVKTIKIHNIATADSSKVLADIYTYNGLALGGPTYNNALYPPLDSFIQKLIGREINHHHLAFFGGGSWAERAVKIITDYSTMLKMETIEQSVAWKHAPKSDDLNQAIALGRTLGNQILSDSKTLSISSLQH